MSEEVLQAALDAFIEARQWNPAIIDELGLRPVRDDYGVARIRFPFRVNGTTVYYQDRAVGGSKYRWLSAEGRTPCPYEIDRLGLATDGWCWLVEGLTDLCALVSDFPHAAVVAMPGSVACKPEYAPLFRGLSLAVLADNDRGGEITRHRVNEILGPVAHEVRHLEVPVGFNDVDEWRRADPVSWPYQMIALSNRS